MNARLIAIAVLLGSICSISIAGFLNPGLAALLALMPRTADQWWGLITSVFVHRDAAHLLANTATLAVFLVLLQIKGSRTFFAALGSCWLLGALGLWCFGRSGAHVGASGLVFALFGLLLANAYFARRWTDVLIAVPVVLGYWGLITGLVPGDPRISWDGHLTGLVAGVFTSWGLSKPLVQSLLVADAAVLDHVHDSVRNGLQKAKKQ